jgi:hypothetical protein
MTAPSRREFAAATVGVLAMTQLDAAEPPKPEVRKPVEAPFNYEYERPKFQPGWKKPQLNRELVQDFVMFGHGDLAMVKKLLELEPALLNAAVDWGGGDWETALGGASHIGSREVAEYLLEKGARADIFTFTMLGQLEIVQTFLKLQPKLIDAKGPHGIGLHMHAKMGGKDAEKVLEYLQGIKKVEFPAPKVKK